MSEAVTADALSGMTPRRARIQRATAVVVVASWALLALVFHDPLYDAFAILASIVILAGSAAFFVWDAPPGREGFRLLGFFVCGQAFLSSGLGLLVPEDESLLQIMPTTEAFSFAVESTVVFSLCFLVGAYFTAPRKPVLVSTEEVANAGPTTFVAIALAVIVGVYSIGITTSFAESIARLGTLPLVLFNPHLAAPLLMATVLVSKKRLTTPLLLVVGSQLFLTFLSSMLGLAIYAIRDALLALVFLRRPLPMKWIALAAVAFVLLNPAKHVFRALVIDSGEKEVTATMAFSFWGEAISESWDRSPRDNHPGTLESSAKRLNYNSMTAHVYTLVPSRLAHEEGRTYEDIPITLIPRILYPNKPDSSTYMRGRWLIKLGLQNRETVRGTSFAIPAPAEAYWNFGWLGVAGVPIVLGLVVGLILRLAPRDPAARAGFTVLAVILLGQLLDMLIWVIPQFVTVIVSAGLVRLYCQLGKRAARSGQRPAAESLPNPSMGR